MNAPVEHDVAAETPPEAGAVSARGAWASRLVSFDERGVLLALIVAFVAAALLSGNFVTTGNLTGILQDVTFLGFVSIGVSMVLLTGEIDISVGSTYGLTGVVTALLLKHGVALELAILAGLGVGLAAGLANGLACALLKVPAVIVTLATLGIYRGFSLVIADGAPVGGMPDIPGFFGTFGNGDAFGGISWITVLFLVTALVAGVVMARTAFGFRAYAVGSNSKAAHLVGFDVTRTRVTVLALSGLLAGVAGVSSVAYLDGATPTGGSGYELDALAAVIIGGVKLTGGRGSIFGVVLGLAVVGIIRNILVLASVSANWQSAVSGAVLVAAVTVDRVTKRREEDR